MRQHEPCVYAGLTFRAVRSLLALAALCLFVASPAQAAPRELDLTVRSTGLDGTAHLLVVLPHGDSASTRRYPVVYFLHGLPAGPTTYRGYEWVPRALVQAGNAILVIPEAARDGDDDPEYLNWGQGRQWETYISNEIPAYVDSHFRTIAARRGRALVGLSAGGYGATVLGIRHLGAFSVIESWSGYFHPTDPTGTKPLARTDNVNVHGLIPVLVRNEMTLPTYLAFYVGKGDSRFRAEDVQFNDELTKARVPHAFAVYPGGHDSALWQSHAVVWLRMALRHLAQ